MYNNVVDIFKIVSKWCVCAVWTSGFFHAYLSGIDCLFMNVDKKKM